MQYLICYTDDLTTGVHRVGLGDHRHDNCEFMLETLGSATNWVNGSSETLKTGDVRFLNTRIVHAITDLSRDHEHYDIYVSLETLKNICVTMFDEQLYRELTESSATVPIWISGSEFTQIIARLTELDFCYGLNTTVEGRDAYAKCMRAIIVQLLGHYYESTRLAHGNAPRWLVEFLRSLKAPEVFQYNLEEIISGSGYSHTRFCTLFKQYFGKSFKVYINELRINYACAMLISTDSSILDIALTVGYSSASHFIKRFKEELGVSPRVYRSMHLK